MAGRSLVLLSVSLVLYFVLAVLIDHWVTYPHWWHAQLRDYPSLYEAIVGGRATDDGMPMHGDDDVEAERDAITAMVASNSHERTPVVLQGLRHVYSSGMCSSKPNKTAVRDLYFSVQSGTSCGLHAARFVSLSLQVNALDF